MYDALHAAAPNIPEEVIRLWLLPFAEGGGFPVPQDNQWDKKKTGEEIQFWNASEWEKTTVDLSTLPYSRSYDDTMRGLRDAYHRGIQNAYWDTLGEDGKRRYENCYRYILRNRTFPQPPILSLNDVGRYDILDGNHRFFAYVSAEATGRQFEAATPQEQEAFLAVLGGERFEYPHLEQEIWICRPNWENSPSSRTRVYLRTQGCDL
jgi:hypothetical protein